MPVHQLERIGSIGCLENPEAGLRDPLTAMDWVNLYALAVNGVSLKLAPNLVHGIIGDTEIRERALRTERAPGAVTLELAALFADDAQPESDEIVMTKSAANDE